MSIEFGVDEIFEIAEQIERNGAAFYRKAAESIPDPRNRRLLLDLAAMEENHEKIFTEMRQSLSVREREPVVFDPDNQGVLYLQAFAGGQVFDLTADPREFLRGGKTVREILKKAVELEKDSVVFYVGMQEMLPERLGKGRVDEIIKEEMAHIALLSKELALLQSPPCDQQSGE